MELYALMLCTSKRNIQRILAPTIIVIVGTNCHNCLRPICPVLCRGFTQTFEFEIVFNN